MLHNRAAAVKAELLGLALTLERADDLDVSWLSETHKLLTNGCDSPLYNPDIHISELWATLYYLQVGRAPAGKLDAYRVGNQVASGLTQADSQNGAHGGE